MSTSPKIDFKILGYKKRKKNNYHKIITWFHMELQI